MVPLAFITEVKVGPSNAKVQLVTTGNKALNNGKKFYNLYSKIYSTNYRNPATIMRGCPIPQCYDSIH